MDKSSIEVGNTLTTNKSKITGVVKEIVKNANGSLRIRLDVNGQDRWTTVKQFSQDLGLALGKIGSLECFAPSPEILDYN